MNGEAIRMQTRLTLTAGEGHRGGACVVCGHHSHHKSIGFVCLALCCSVPNHKNGVGGLKLTWGERDAESEAEEQMQTDGGIRDVKAGHWARETDETHRAVCFCVANICMISEKKGGGERERERIDGFSKEVVVVGCWMVHLVCVLVMSSRELEGERKRKEGREAADSKKTTNFMASPLSLCSPR